MPRNDNNTNKKNNVKTKGNYQKANIKKKNKKQKAPTLKPTTAKTKPFLAKKPEDKHGEPFEYKMAHSQAMEILRECPSTVKPQQYLCDYVNAEYGLLGWCQRVILEE